MTINPLHPPLPNQAGTVQQWGDLSGASVSLAVSNAAQQTRAPYLIITLDNTTSTRLYYELQFFNPHLPLLIFPDWETLPYDHFSPPPDIISERLQALHRLPSLKQGIVLVSIATLLQKIAPRHYIDGNTFVFRRGETLDVDTFRQRLQQQSYQCVEQVLQHGEFAVRGSLIDVYPMGSELPYRIDLFDNEIDSIRTFDPETQRSFEPIDAVNMLPAHEFPLDEKAITQFRQNWRSEFEGNPNNCPIYQDVSQGFSAAGVEYYLPLFFNDMATLLDYLPDQTQIIQIGNLQAAAEKYWQDVEQRYEQYRYDITRPLLAPSRWLASYDHLIELSNLFATIKVEPKKFQLPNITINPKASQPLADLQTFLNNSTGRILLCAETNGRREALMEKLQTITIQPTLYSDWQTFLNGSEKIGIAVAALDEGLQLTEPDIILIAEAQLYGQHVLQRRTRKSTAQDTGTIIRNLAELSIGSPVVHIDHGVGLYRGLQTIQAGDIISEYLTIEYADNNKLYVPVANLNLITRYGGIEADKVSLNHLGSPQWSKAREKAARRAYDAAAELLDIHARREAKPGFAFKAPDEHYQVFTAAFPFEETPDQELAIKHVINDMTRPQAMDRLICGDVGFGKTEVAMRAAFLAVQSGKQVAVLVPTTLLAQQHFDSFTDRFADTATVIDLLSRFRTAKQQQEALDKLAKGKIDIIIGTHKLIQKDVKFHDLGLLIIDEEHRFGVQQKERLKSLRAEVDILTLTATPIPRTLNMALSDVRDLSIIATPPAKRLSIKTFVYEYGKPIIREAILREISRGGQVYFLHNNVDTIVQRAREIQELVPEAKIGIGHGQMRESELEKVMADFYHQRFNVLVCTTIIETGIDIPSANTIIMERADKLGLAQMHQLRGRVGRSHHQAYAYLLTPPKAILTSDAEKRLDAITSLEDLGAGFTLATHDLEIRGAGEFLGDEQTGHIQTIGLSLYMEFLEKAVASIKSGKQVDFNQPLIQSTEVDLNVSALIPENYLPDVHTRLVLYKRIASSIDNEALRELQVEMIDRFGLLPQEVKNLFTVTEIKLQAQPLGIKKIVANAEWGRFEFEKQPNIDPMKIIKLIQVFPKLYKLEGQDKLRFSITDDKLETRINAVQELLKKLM